MTIASQLQSPPDWSSVTTTIRCPLCEYELRGLTEPRCPECGKQFAWRQLLDPSERLHPYLFEHHPERNARSFIQTAFGGLNPWRFWSALQPQQPSSRRRLLGYWIICVVLAAASLIPPYVEQLRILANRHAIERAWYVKVWPALSADQQHAVLASRVPPFPTLTAFLDNSYPSWNQRELYVQAFGTPSNFGGYLFGGRLLFIAWCLWPWATAIVFLLLRATMRSARVKPVHVVRLVVYTFDAGAWVGSIALTAYGLVLFNRLLNPTSWIGLEAVQTPLIWLCCLLGALMMIRLFVASRRYLRIRHAMGVAAASQVIAFLLILAVLPRITSRDDTFFSAMNAVIRFFRTL